jgi:hypothetical protein
MPTVLAAAIALLVGIQASQVPQPARDAKPAPDPPAGTSTIRGRVTDRVTGQPIPRIVVRLSGQSPGKLSTSNTRTDGDGRYEFSALAAGRYSVMFNPGQNSVVYLSQAFGPDRPFEAMTRLRQIPTAIQLTEGETKIADVALWRTLAVEGRVFDDAGDPMANVNVSIARWNPDDGFMTSRSTDDRGAFRLFGLAPGEYRLCAMPREPSLTEERGEPERPAKTCYPSSLGGVDAQPLALTTSDLAGLDIKVHRSQVFTVTGVALDSSGMPLVDGTVSFVRTEGRSVQAIGVPTPGGRFTIRNVMPGEYGIRAEREARTDAQGTRAREIGYVRFQVQNENVENLVVSMARAARVAGRVVFEDGVPAAMPRNVMINAEPIEGFATASSMVQVPVKDDQTFVLDGLFGSYRLQPWRLPTGWILKSVTYRGQDVTHRPIEFRAGSDPRDLEVVLTSRGALVRGRVILEPGTDPSHVSVVLLPAALTPTASRDGVAAGATLTPDGSFQLPLVRAGEYFLLAVPVDVFPVGNRLSAPGYAHRIAGVADRVLLGEGEQRSIELKVVKFP